MGEIGGFTRAYVLGSQVVNLNVFVLQGLNFGTLYTHLLHNVDLNVSYPVFL